MMLGLIPESLEESQGECLTARTASLPQFRFLGPPDLVQLSKSTKTKQSSAYHFVTGVDVSSSAAIAAHFNILSYALGETQVWFGRAPQWKVIGGTYCCWNAFASVDVRVSVDIPGGTEAYLVYPHQGGLTRKLSEISEQEQEILWQQVSMSAFIRSLVLKDDDAFLIEKCRHEDPISTPEDVDRFVATFEALYFLGPTVGASSDYQVPSLGANYMVDALFKVLRATGRYQPAIESLQRLGDQDHSAHPLLARVYLLANREVEAVNLMVNSVKIDPRNAPMLSVEGSFLLKKGLAAKSSEEAKEVLDLALDCALRAADAAPSDFYPWELLTNVYIARNQWEEALLSLNSCPLIPSHSLDTQRLPSPKRVHCPLPTDGIIDEVWAIDPSVKDEEDKADVVLMRLPATQLRGATSRAFALLAKIYSEIDWHQLMKVRSEVFLMENESKPVTNAKSDAGDKTKPESGSEPSEAKSEPASETVEAEKASDAAATQNSSDGIQSEPTSEESGKASEGATNGDVGAEKTAKPSTNGDAEAKTIPRSQSQEIAPAPTEKRDSTTHQSIRSKRLCERRIDNLFMILYEDVRAYSNWQREAVHFQSQQLSYNKTAHEWELFGLISQRLHHDVAAKDAFARSLDKKFSHRILWKLLDYVAPIDADSYADSTLVLDIVVKLLAWNHRWYTEFSPRLSQVLRKIVAQEGLKIVQLELEAQYSEAANKGVMVFMKEHLKKLKLMGCPGTDM